MWLKSARSVIMPASTALASTPHYAPAGSGSHRTAAGSNQTGRGDVAGWVTGGGSAGGKTASTVVRLTWLLPYERASTLSRFTSAIRGVRVIAISRAATGDRLRSTL